jgi:haloacetate dehalogenase
MIDAETDAYLREKMGAGSAGMKPFTEEAWREYRRCFTPGAIHASCEDYRASAAIDLEHDRADREAGRKVKAPLHALWGANGVVERCFKPLEEWRRVADQVTGRALPAGHYLPEEVPELVLEELEEFFR